MTPSCLIWVKALADAVENILTVGFSLEQDMSDGEIAYLAMVIAGATIFGLVLAYYSTRRH